MYRKIEKDIYEYFQNNDKKILCIYGARQIGKTYIIEKCCNEKYKHFIEINFHDDNLDKQYFKNVNSKDSLYLQLTSLYGLEMNDFSDTIVFLDEIQEYPQYIPLLKQLAIDQKYKFICSGSQLGISMNSEGLSPMGYVINKRMYPMDFEEFLIANSFSNEAIDYVHKSFLDREEVNEGIHKVLINHFLEYLYVGGLPECVSIFIKEKNIAKIKQIQELTYDYYASDASKYDKKKKLRIHRIYEMMLSCIENKVNRIQVTKIDNNFRKSYSDYFDEFDYLEKSGISLCTKAISNPKFPLVQSSEKTLTKLYFNDVGILANKLYKNNINAIIESKTGVNLGSIYETVVAQELAAHGHHLFYYDRRKEGEVDFLVDNYDDLSIVPIEIKSSKERYYFRALPRMVNNEEYRIKEGIVLSNKREVVKIGKITQLPIYYIMFI